MQAAADAGPDAMDAPDSLDALVLAGGFGTRLAAVVPDLPKPMAPVAGKPFLELLLGALRSKGVRRVVLSLGYRAEMIRSHFGDLFRSRFGDMDIRYVIEDRPLGTGGAIRAGLAQCRGDAALVVNCDTLLDLDVAAITAQWQARRRPLLVACHVDDTARYGRVDSDEGRLVRFAEKGVAGPGWINSGHYVLPRSLFDGHALPETFSFEADFVVPRLATLGFEVVESAGSFIDIGVPEDYQRAQTELQRWA
jgi:D-glycero-alpha-D-manno-heptose 1-phosphate guanylyltransferase